MAIEMKKTRVKIIKPLYLGMSISDISKTLTYDFGAIILTQSMETEQSYDTDSFIINIKIEYFFEAICNGIEGWFDSSNYDKNDTRPLPIGKNKKVPGLFKDELGGKIITEVVALRQKRMHI